MTKEETNVKYDLKTRGQIAAYEKLAEKLREVQGELVERQNKQTNIKGAYKDIERDIQGMITLLGESYEKGEIGELLDQISKSENPEMEFMKAIRTAYQNCIEKCRSRQKDSVEEAQKIKGEASAHLRQATTVMTLMNAVKAEAQRKAASAKKLDEYKESRKTKKKPGKKTTKTKAESKKTKPKAKPTTKKATKK